MHDWLVLQLADTAFPTGGFAHSSGLEAMAQLGGARDADAVRRFVDDAIWQAALGATPFVREAHGAFVRDAHAREAHDIVAVDAACDAFLTATVANRASRIQGRAFVATAARVYGRDALLALHDAVRARRTAGHHAPIFGACLAILGVEEDDAARLFLHLVVRGVTSAAVRLGLLGPHEAHAVHHERGALLDRALLASRGLRGSDAVHVAPLVEIFGNHQDGLYSRLFSS